MNQHHHEPGPNSTPWTESFTSAVPVLHPTTPAGRTADAVPELDWEPAEKYLPAHLLDDDDIMLMPGAFHHAGAVVQLYKHRDTRRYLYLDTLGRAWARAGEYDLIPVDRDHALAYLTGRTDAPHPAAAADPSSGTTSEPSGATISDEKWDATHGVVYDDPPF